MIIPMANQLIKESIQDLKLNNHMARRKLTGKMLDYYEGENTAKYIEDKFKAEAFREVPPLFINFTHRFINKMARIYRTGAVRNVNDVYSSLTKFKNIKLKHVERIAKLLGTVAVRIDYNENTQQLNYHPIYHYHPFTYDNNPLTPFAISYEINSSTDDVSQDTSPAYIYLDNERSIRYNADGKVEEESQEN